jgi:hypothetical protein
VNVTENSNSSPEINISKTPTKPTIYILLRKHRRPDIDESQVWSLATTVDELFFSMMDVKVAFCILNSHRKTGFLSEGKRVPEILEKFERFNNGTGIPRRLYEEQAKYKMYRIPVFRPPPVFVVYLKHLDDRLKQELLGLDRKTKDFVLREAIGRIFEQVDSRFFLLSVKALLQWRLE